jgi:hypothetical protein
MFGPHRNVGVFYFQQGLDLGPLVNVVWQKYVLHLPNNIG